MKHENDCYVLSIDIGSSSTSSAVYNSLCKKLPTTFTKQRYSINHGLNGEAEIDAATILDTCRESITFSFGSFQENKPNPDDKISAVGISCFWHSLLGIDENLEPLTPVITWADNSGIRKFEVFKQKFDQKEYHRRTGCFLHSSYWPAKLLKLAGNNPEIFSKVKYWLSPGEWIQWKLFGVKSCSYSMASGTGLFNLDRKCWDEELLSSCNIEAGQLLEPTSKSVKIKQGDLYGFKEIAGASCFPPIGDGAASNLGCGADDEGVAAINYGTSAAVRVITRDLPDDKENSLFTYLVDEHLYLVGGATSNAGNLRVWCLNNLNIGDGDNAEAILGSKRGPVKNLDILPYLGGERAPFWRDDLTGMISGLSFNHSADDIYRAVIDATFLSLTIILDLLPVGSLEKIIVSGGITESPAMLQRLADVIGRKIYSLVDPDASLKGAALNVLFKSGYKPAITTDHLQAIEPDKNIHKAYLHQQKRMTELYRQVFE